MAGDSYRRLIIFLIVLLLPTLSWANWAHIQTESGNMLKLKDDPTNCLLTEFATDFDNQLEPTCATASSATGAELWLGMSTVQTWSVDTCIPIFGGDPFTSGTGSSRLRRCSNTRMPISGSVTRASAYVENNPGGANGWIVNFLKATGTDSTSIVQTVIGTCTILGDFTGTGQIGSTLECQDTTITGGALTTEALFCDFVEVGASAGTGGGGCSMLYEP